MQGQARLNSTVRTVLACLLVAGLLLPAAQASADDLPPASTTTKTLILYDTGGPWGHLGELYASMTANLVSHFGGWTAKPVTSYTANEMKSYTAVIYIGSTWDEALPTSFLDEVIAETRPVIWINRNIWEIADRTGFTDKFGWHWSHFDEDDVQAVRYKGQTFKRDANNPRGIMDYTVLNPSKINVIADAVRPDGSTFPWAIRSENLTYIGENPFAYISEGDRYVIFSDMLFDILAPKTMERHRAMVRLEDVSCVNDPANLRQIADYLYSQRVPFSFGVIPYYRDPLGRRNELEPIVDPTDDDPLSMHLGDRGCRDVVSALKYMMSRGGTMILHGYTHQLDSMINPYNGVSGDDFEFYTAHIDADNYVRYDGPVPGDSYNWAYNRIQAAIGEFKKAKLNVPAIWEFPHYGASDLDYKAAGALFRTAYERRLYFAGPLNGGKADYTKMAGQFFPYVVKDVYGTKVLPENIGNIETESFNHHPITLPDELIARARRNLAVRDGFASFFYHPDIGVDLLRQTVSGIKALGYTFVSPTSL